MMASLSLLALVIMLEAQPVAEQLRAHQRGERFGLDPRLLLAAARWSSASRLTATICRAGSAPDGSSSWSRSGSVE